MGFWKITSFLMMTIYTMVFCCMRVPFVLAWNIMTRFQAKTLKATCKNETQKSGHTDTANKLVDFNGRLYTSHTTGYSSCYANDSNFTPAQMDHPINLFGLMHETYGTKYEQMKMDQKCSAMDREMRIVSNSNKMMQERLQLLEEILYQEKRNQEDFQMAVKETFYREAEDRENLQMAIKGQLRFRDNGNDSAQSASRETYIQMQQQIKMLKDSETTMVNNIQMLFEKLEHLNRKKTASTSINCQASHGTDEKIRQLKGIMLAKKKSLMLPNKKLTKKITSLKSKVAVLNRNNSRNVDMLRRDLNSLRMDFKTFESRFNKKVEYSENQFMTKSVQSEHVDSENNIKLTHKYDQLKFRLSMVEKSLANVSSSRMRSMKYFGRENINEPTTNILKAPSALPAPPAPPATPPPPTPPAPIVIPKPPPATPSTPITPTTPMTFAPQAPIAIPAPPNLPGAPVTSVRPLPSTSSVPPTLPMTFASPAPPAISAATHATPGAPITPATPVTLVSPAPPAIPLLLIV